MASIIITLVIDIIMIFIVWSGGIGSRNRSMLKNFTRCKYFTLWIT